LKALIDEEIIKVQQLKGKAREIKDMNAKSRTIRTQQSDEAISLLGKQYGIMRHRQLGRGMLLILLHKVI